MMYYDVFSSFWDVLPCIEMYWKNRSRHMTGTHGWGSIGCINTCCPCINTCWMYSTQIHAIYMQKAMYSSLLGCFAVFENRGEQCGCILDVLACILHVLAVSRCINIEYIKIHPNYRACKVRMYWRDLDVLYLYRGCIRCIGCIHIVFGMYCASILGVFWLRIYW
jgi:hypothetical protein